ncbi:type II toxin-antitoxin system RelE/ParE family toxin [Dasania sp. GY-MA-18]|uniref:Type II toxin-antitoxin system RelE/ParE family toxin n=1 Tax=Dasania phycosphaerae TaxID=2950436 RepID=A0A9J6RLI1_9GAMM|nr:MULTISPECIES: type II toxin-antitoxin system RelE/ParE family toxin [Dasania]MCR8922634.1 type II toxin-antitoxin system RelE/ParE family toxin [Dasania sp. GY-MA-18]MCZ0865064.1 type II toxin-antitoxin system RelE/ParE family toxin [Dasania phycosphaerae]MCZ0868790.1 type II toxin-antitoxin system RelE/ParE family toxin [Dasania phycosphaerae]
MGAMVIIETSVFTRLIKELMSDDEYKNLQEALVSRPNMGDLIKGSGGIRKVRWQLEGRGKSGGVRVIYYWVVNDDHIRMLYVYPKGKQVSLSKAQVAQLKAIVERW